MEQYQKTLPCTRFSERYATSLEMEENEPTEEEHNNVVNRGMGKEYKFRWSKGSSDEAEREV